jgi:uncharacterized membrane protein
MSDAVAVIVAITLGLALLAVVGAAVTVLIVRLMPWPKSPGLNILRERYAKGELTDERYEEMRRRLGK